MTKAVVFAYHQVGVRCLEVLLAQGTDVSLVFTHQDDPNETQWFPSVAERAREYGLRVVTPDSPNTDDWIEEVKAHQPDFIFSFYYRHMLSKALLAIPHKGALNMHGSLLPRYRGRVPVNWAVLHGETETGATLHDMTEKADQGDILDQETVTILPNDTAYDVFQKVCVAAESVLFRSLPKLFSNSAVRHAQDESQASYFGRRTPEDGRIDWSGPALSIHNLIRAVSPPYPGAFFDWHGERFVVERSLRVLQDSVPAYIRVKLSSVGILIEQDEVWARCGDGEFLRLFRLRAMGADSLATKLKMMAIQHTFGNFLL